MRWNDEGSPIGHLEVDDGARCLLLGEANPYGPDPTMALFPLPENAAGGRLQRLILGVPRHAYMTDFDRVNLCRSTWSVREARATAEFVAQAVTGPGRWDAVVLCGAKVTEAFRGLLAVPTSAPFGTATGERPHHPDGRYRVASIPHPSGRCREWNRAGSYARARAVVRHAAPWLADALGTHEDARS